MNIRHATIHDLDAITAVEAECFPAAEAATYESIKGRLEPLPTISGCWRTAIRWWASSTVWPPICRICAMRCMKMPECMIQKATGR